jgi:succinate dehydrogenase hydrophobic anchor subunit
VTKPAAAFVLTFSVVLIALAAHLQENHDYTSGVMVQSVAPAPLFSSPTDSSDKLLLRPQSLDDFNAIRLSGVFGFCFVGLCLFRLLFQDAGSKLHSVRSISAIASSADIHGWAPRIAKNSIFTPLRYCGLIFPQHYLVYYNIPFSPIFPRTALPHSVVGMPNIHNRFSKHPTAQELRNSLFASMFIIAIISALKVLLGYAATLCSWSQLRFASPTEETFSAISSTKCASGEIGLLLGRVFDSYVSFMASASRPAVSIWLALVLTGVATERLCGAFVRQAKSIFRRRLQALDLVASSDWLVRLSLGWLDRVQDVAAITAPNFAIPTPASAL